jgi:hypothetical protein
MTEKQKKIFYITFLILGLFAFVVLLVDEKKYFFGSDNNNEIVNTDNGNALNGNNGTNDNTAVVEPNLSNSGSLDSSGTSQNNPPAPGSSQSSGNQPSNNPTSGTNNPNPPVSSSGSATPPAPANTATPPATPPSSPRLPIQQLQPPTAQIPIADLGAVVTPPGNPTNQQPAISNPSRLPAPTLNTPGNLVLPNLTPHPLVEWRIDSGLCILSACPPVITVIYSDGKYEKNGQFLTSLSASELSLLKQQIEQLDYTSLLSRAAPQGSSAYGCSSSFNGLSHTKYQYVFHPASGDKMLVACDHEITAAENPFQLLNQFYLARP